MSTLHVLSHSPFSDTRLSSCLRVMGANDALLLCGDAVYALQPNSAPLRALEDKRNAGKFFILEEDLRARGLACPEWVTAVDYSGFVDLSICHDKVNSWL